MGGFLRFLLAVGLVILGIVLIGGAFTGGLQTGMANSLFGSHTSTAAFWVIGIVGFIVFLGGIYMLRRH
jgi:hypothetical protein